MTTLFSGKTASKEVKRQLKLVFPNTKFSVRYESFSGGDAIRISWAYGPTQDQVKQVAQKFEYGRFDGMTDTSYTEDTLVVTPTGNVARLGGAKFVSESRVTSYEFHMWLLSQFKTLNEGSNMTDHNYRSSVNQLLWSTPLGNWTDEEINAKIASGAAKVVRTPKEILETLPGSFCFVQTMMLVVDGVNYNFTARY